MTSHELFAAMSPGLATEILDFNHGQDRPIYRGALDAVAQARKLRAVFLERQPRGERQALMIESLSRPNLAMAADTLLRNWLLKQQTKVLVDFLDALQIKHEKGVVEELPTTVEDAALRQAVDQLLTKHPPEVVAVYLHAFNVMNAESWGNLETLLQEEPRLRLPGAVPRLDVLRRRGALCVRLLAFAGERSALPGAGGLRGVRRLSGGGEPDVSGRRRMGAEVDPERNRIFAGHDPVPLSCKNKLDPCFEEFGKPHQTGSARLSWPP
jgi:hypothetical protein